MTHDVIVSRAVAFTDPATLEGYMAGNLADTPKYDIWMPDVHTIIMGYNKVVLKGEDGRTRFVGNRRQIKGLAVDGQAVPVHGEKFRRITIEGDKYAVITSRKNVEKTYTVDYFEGVEYRHAEFGEYEEAKAFFDKTAGAMLTEIETTKRYKVVRDAEYVEEGERG